MDIPSPTQDSTVYVLLAVDVAKAVAADSLQGAIVVTGTSTPPWIGKPGLPTTSVKNGGKIVWTVTSIDPSQKVSISKFSGAAVPRMLNPSSCHANNQKWSSSVMEAGSEPYVITLSLGDHGVPKPYIVQNLIWCQALIKSSKINWLNLCKSLQIQSLTILGEYFSKSRIISQLKIINRRCNVLL